MPSSFPYHNHITLISSIPSSIPSRDPIQTPSNNPSRLTSAVPSVEPSKDISTVPSYVPSDIPSRAPNVVKILETYPQVLHIQFLRVSLLVVLDLYRHMYQVVIYPDLQVLFHEVSLIGNIVNFHYLYQAQVHRGIQVKNLTTFYQGFLVQFLKLRLLKILRLCHHM